MQEYEYICHHGVKGMHWGFRKDGGPQGHKGTYPKKSLKRIKRNIKRKLSPKKKRIDDQREDLSQYSNSELQEMITRLRLENDYMNLKYPQNMNRGSAFEQRLKNKAADKAAESIINESIGLAKMAPEIAPKLLKKGAKLAAVLI